jgi:hypothetical protein
MRTRRRPEDAIPRVVVQHLRARGMAGLVAIHVGNGGYRRGATGSRGFEAISTPSRAGN